MNDSTSHDISSARGLPAGGSHVPGDPGAPALAAFPRVRPRRLRQSPAVRRMVRETRIEPSQLILPLFVREDATEPVPISALPGQEQHTIDSLRRIAARAAEAGIGGVNLFGIPAHLDAVGSQADAADGIVQRGVRAMVEEVGDAIVIQTDLCLDEFTDHGHCGVLDAQGRVDNDATLERYGAMALAQAEAGSHMLAPSGMMDGQIGYLRDVLDANGYQDVMLLAYAAKYASGFYGPFREAVDSQLKGDRRTYQQDPANGREGVREAQLDIAEGADVVMVKPAASFLDVLYRVSQISPVPVWAYQVSGEYASIEAAAANGWLDRERVIDESVTGIFRAGAEALLTYWALEVADRLKHGSFGE
ncbi:porphobilinogen synthase [Pseudoclavibacter sp. CFCC 13796]|uniref:porphobilinogen synthase n=1 Tax=Pseudoclavibacter sp. CFCC 13796 TaxID=2615179 RepID=UPI0013015F5E|nr:porphobilinogen synthase [Pseudoclavibacter sp. CFCC 13796]KAB1659807.1 porphobilinogen synthase [Pseudoclavibacter sp. CFCC 13796]